MTKPVIDHKPPGKQTQPLLSGKDELNLSEFPLTKMGTSDNRDVLVYAGWASDKKLGRFEQKWTVRGAAGIGLPNEFGDRALLALLALTFRQNPLEPKVKFNRYALLKHMGVKNIGQKEYKHLEKSLTQLAGVTIVSERAFFDQSTGKRPVITHAFHIFDELKFRSEREEGSRVAQARDDGADGNQATGEAASRARARQGRGAKVDRLEEGSGYITWSHQFWKNLQGGYIKQLDLAFLNTLPTPLARRLFRLLDKRMHYRASCELDIMELSGRLGMQRYDRASQVYRKLKPSIDILIAERYLKSAEMVKYGIYTRLRFERWGLGEFAKHQESLRQRESTLKEVEENIGLDKELASVWAAVLQQLDASLSGTQRALLTASHLLPVEGEHVRVLVPHRFAAERLTAHPNVGRTICAALSTALNQPLATIACLDIDQAKGRAE